MNLGNGRLGITLLLAIGTCAAQLAPAKVIIIIGPPGSGKSVQAAYLRKKYKIPAISVSALIQKQMGKKGIPDELAAGIASGDLMQDDAANQLIQTEILKSKSPRGFVLDGYPATAAQAKAFDEFLSGQKFPKPIVVILEAPDDVVRKRMLARKRVDDKPDIIDRRIREFRDQARFLEEWYRTGNMLHVDATAAIPVVSHEIDERLDEAAGSKNFATRP